MSIKQRHIKKENFEEFLLKTNTSSKNILLAPTTGIAKSFLKSTVKTRGVDVSIKTPVGLFDYFSGITDTGNSFKFDKLLITAEILKSFSKEEILIFTEPPRDDYGWLLFSKKVLKTRSLVTLSGLFWSKKSWSNRLGNFFVNTKIDEGFFCFFEKFNNKYAIETQKMGILDKNNQRELFWKKLKKSKAFLDYSLFVIPGFNSYFVVDTLLQTARLKCKNFILLDDCSDIDSAGLINESNWGKKNINLKKCDLVSTKSIDDTINTVVEIINLDKHRSVAFGASSDKTIQRLGVSLDINNIRWERAAGTPLTESSAYGFTLLLTQWVNKRNWRSFSSLVRNASLMKTLGFFGGDLEELDRYQRDHLPLRPIDENNQEFFDNKKVKEIVERVMVFLGAFSENKPIFWNDAYELYVKILRSLFGRHEKKQRGVLLDGVLDFFDKKNMPQKNPLTTPHSFLSFTMKVYEEKNKRCFFNKDIVRVFNWVDFSYISADVKIFLDGHSGSLPSNNENVESLLPAFILEKIKPHNRTSLFARDSFLMERSVLKSKKSIFFCSQKNSTGDPVMPSPLFFRCEGLEKVNERVDNLILNPGTMKTNRAGVSGNEYPVVKLMKNQFFKESYSVNDLCKYLRDPTLYVYENVMGGFSELDDQSHQMSLSETGSVIHAVLESFGKNKKISKSESPVDIERWVVGELNRYMFDRFGNNPLPSVHIQHEQLKKRLVDFSKARAERNQEGWNIIEVESVFLPGDFGFDIKGCFVGVHGRVDLIEVNKNTGDLSVFDIKTGSLGPEESHRFGRPGSRVWKNLQLPVYRMFIKHRYGVFPKQVGFVLVGSQGTFWKKANWKKEDYLQAKQKTIECLNNIRDGVVNVPPKDSSALFNFGYQRFLQTGTTNKLDTKIKVCADG